MSKRALQLATAILACVPLSTGLLTMLGVFDPLYRTLALPAAPLLDSNLRFFGGIWFVVGLAFLTTIRNIEREAKLYRLLWGAIFFGGIGRIWSAYSVGAPPLPFIAFTGLELAGAPLFILWQNSVARHQGLAPQV